MTTAPLAAIDVETTGLHSERRVWEVAIIRRDPDTLADRELVLQVADVDLSAADPKGLQIGGFYDRHHQYAPPPRIVTGAAPAEYLNVMPDKLMTLPPERRLCEPSFDPPLHPEAEVARQVEQWTRGAHLIGVNPAFDAATLDPMLRRHGLVPAWNYHVVDVSAMALGWLHRDRPHHVRDGDGRPVDWPDGFDVVNLPPWRSDDLSRACGVEPPGEAGRHTALGDALWALRWYDHLTGATPA